MKNLFLIITIVIAITGCAQPSSSIIQSVDDRAMLIVEGAPPDSYLIVDGLSMGDAGQFTMKKGALALESGTHMIEIKNDTKVFYTGKKFLGPGQLETLRLNNGSSK